MPVWFKPKRYGYGATPTTWQGWAIVVGFALAVLALVWTMIGFNPSAEPDSGSLIAFFVIVALLVAALCVVVNRTTDGQWRWRWGEDN